MFAIENGFKNINNQEYPNIRNIHYDELKDVQGNVGTFITETEYEGVDADSSFKLNNGVYIYKAFYNPRVALRFYKDFADYAYTFHNDEKIVSKLQEKQDRVKLTKFPTGIITIGNKVVGQEIPYYEDHRTLLKTFRQKGYKQIPTHYYIEILKILKELYQANIVYSDTHAKNFMISMIDDTIKLIDFDSSYLSFDENSDYLYKAMITNLKNMIMKLNRLSDIKFSQNFTDTQTLEEIEESVLENQEKILKKA